ncbi:MAG: phage tail sheath subtilisin-like domain-containing protein [Anaerolineae bacterium]
MPFNYKSPGVYIEEVDKGAKPIEAAGTSVLAMIGFCAESIQVEKTGQGMVTQKTPNTPTLVTSWTQFVNTYGDVDQAVPGGYLHSAMYGYFLNGGAQAFVVGLPVPVKTEVVPNVPLLPAGEGYLLNAGGARTVRVTTTGPLKKDEPINLEIQPAGEGQPPENFNLVVRRGNADPKTVSNVSLGKGRGVRNLVDVLTKETDNLLAAEILDAPGSAQDRMPAVGSKVALQPQPEQPKSAVQDELKKQVTPDLFRGNVDARTGIAGLEAVEEVTLVACPDIVAAYQWGVATEMDVKAVQTAIINHCEMMKDRFAIIDTPLGLSPQDAIAWRKDKMNFDTKYAALYYPWVNVDGQLVPPSGYVAGVYARVDAERGVHKAPANEIVRGVIGLEKNVTRNEQDLLNPIGVNCIRSFPGQGIRIWGARTLSSDASWRYINVRRLFSNVEESILGGTNWIVFEPNDAILWGKINRDIRAFLNVVWREGALFGATPDEAFFVKCDAENNPPELRDLGYCIIEVGMAPVKPAEFVVFKISQKKDGAGGASE